MQDNTYVAFTDAPCAKIESSKDVQLESKTLSLHFKIKLNLLVVVQLFERIVVDGCTWTLEKSNDKLGMMIVVTIEETEAAMWGRRTSEAYVATQPPPCPSMTHQRFNRISVL